MGYTHYWRRLASEDIPLQTFRDMVRDFQALLPEFERIGIVLAGPTGEGAPVLNDDEVAFNGSIHCGHKKMELTIPWPAQGAAGVFATDRPKDGVWVGGDKLNTRVCNGDCSYESFVFPRKSSSGFDFCKTAFRPYDLAVVSFLIIAKRYLGDRISISSDGGPEHWMDGVLLCRMVLGYGEVPF